MIRSRDGVLHIGPADLGLELTHAEFERAVREDGFRYELVAGRLAVTPEPNPPHLVALKALYDSLNAYSAAHPEALAFVVPGGRLLTRALGAPTDVQPDICAYREPLSLSTRDWQGVMPFLVIEVLSPDDRGKDLVRNRELYRLVPEVVEYWVLDPYVEPSPTLLALVRGVHGDWLERPVAAGGAYTTDLLPGLELDLAALFGR